MHFRNKKPAHSEALALDNLQKIFELSPDKIFKQWTIENNGDEGAQHECNNQLLPESILSNQCWKSLPSAFYVSTILQESAKDANNFLRGLITLPSFVKDRSWKNFKHDNAIWIFMGQNSSDGALMGRPEVCL